MRAESRLDVRREVGRDDADQEQLSKSARRDPKVIAQPDQMAICQGNRVASGSLVIAPPKGATTDSPRAATAATS